MFLSPHHGKHHRGQSGNVISTEERSGFYEREQLQVGNAREASGHAYWHGDIGLGCAISCVLSV